MKTAESEKKSCDSNSPTQTIRDDSVAVATSGSRPVPKSPSTRTRSQPPPGCNTGVTEASSRSKCQDPYENLLEMSNRKVENPRSPAWTGSNEIHHRIDAEDEPPLMPPARTPPPTGQVNHTTEEWIDEERAGIPSSSASTASSFLQAAAIPPRLTKQETTPGAVYVPGITGSFDDDQHDNLLDMEDENDEDDINSNNYSGRIFSRLSTSRRSAASAVHSPQSTSFTFYSQSTSTSTPIVAELAPNEREVEDRLAERLEAQITERLQQEVDRRFSQNQRQHAIAEVIGTSYDTGYTNSKNEKQEDENFKICGIRRIWWGMILCVIMLLTIGGVGGTYLWFSRTSRTTIDASFLPSTQPTSPSMPPLFASQSGDNTSSSDNTKGIPTLFVNLTASPTPSPTPFIPSPLPSSTERRREYLIKNIGDFANLPRTYFAPNTFQYSALDWMVTTDLDTDVFQMPVQLLVERYVLAVLYYATGGDRVWSESLSFLSSTNVCNWNNDHGVPKVVDDSGVAAQIKSNATEESKEYSTEKKGVFCRNGSLFVTSIQIPNNSLEGKIPWELSLLNYLEQIDFDTNKISGSIPTELSRLSRLQALWFKSNNLTGRLPVEFSNTFELASLDLEDNSLTSTLPSEWGSLSNLFYVGLRLNNITGYLPSDWRKLNRLKTLDLGGNQLQGTLPEEYGALTELESLYFDSNRFEGLLPTALSNLTNLVNFLVDGNLFSGTVPTEYSALINLKYFWFHHNFLTGSVDDTFCYSFSAQNVASMRSNCLGNDLTGIPAQVECSCCTTCCDSSGTNCKTN